MKKKVIVSLIAIACFIVSMGVISSHAETYTGSCGTNMTYTINTSTGVLTISGTGDMESYGAPDVDAPWWEFADYLETVIINDGVTGISAGAFSYYENIKSITIPASVTYIGRCAFGNFGNLERVYISDLKAWCGIKFADMESNPLYNNANLYINGTLAKNIILTDDITCISKYAFWGCNSINNITFSGNGVSVGEGAFGDCLNLNNVYTDSIETWCNNTFEDETSNPLCNNANLYIDGVLATDITIPATVSSINSNAFFACSSLKNVIISDGVKNIGDRAFNHCMNLVGITISGSVSSIGNNAFDKCEALKSVTIENGVENISYGAFYDCTSLENIIIPDSVTSIGNYAFYGCDGLKSAVISDGVKSIGSRAFYGCTALKTVTITCSDAEISMDAFESCRNLNRVYIEDVAAWCSNSFEGPLANPLFFAKNLYLDGAVATDIVIPDGVTNIGSYVFYNGINLKTITIPESVTKIESNVFKYCSSLKYVFYEGDSTDWQSINIEPTGNDKTFLSATRYYEAVIDGNDAIEAVYALNKGTLNIMLSNAVDSVVAALVMKDEVAITYVSKYSGDDIVTFNLESDADSIKVFVWESLETMHPIIEAITVR